MVSDCSISAYTAKTTSWTCLPTCVCIDISGVRLKFLLIHASHTGEMAEWGLKLLADFNISMVSSKKGHLLLNFCAGFHIS